MTDIYRKIHLGFFRKPLVEITDHGFIYEGKTYSLSQISEVRLTGGNGSPKLLGVILSDGKKILVNSSALELNGKKYSNGFISGTNEALEKLKAYFMPVRN
jgi:hypothetical protein